VIKQQVFQIEGTSGRLYDLGVLLADDILSLSCNCPAGTQKQLCKHVRRILSGKDALDAEIKRAKKGLALALSKGLVKK
jgi:uncharacterized Zn finger protein